MPTLLAFYGSPRKGGNTSTLMDYFLEGVRDSHYTIERIFLRDLSFSPCVECNRCEKTGRCVVQDDMMPFYEKLLQAERIVMAFPVFFLGPPAITKAFIDRAQALWIRKYILHTKPEKEGIVRKGFLLSVGGFRGSERIFACNVSITKSFFATCGYKYSGELLFTGIDHYGDLKKRGEIREDALKAGRDFSVQ